MSRSVLARSLYILWANSNNLEQFYSDLRQCPKASLPQFKNSSFRIEVESYNKKLSLKEKVKKIENISFLPFEGKIDLKEPENSFNLFEYYGSDPNNAPPEPFQILFGLKIADSDRKSIFNLSLRKRKFIANTSMEPMLGVLMANIARIKSSDVVLDPFVGSGSLLVSAAYAGAYVLGADIDYKLLHGLTKPSRCGTKRRDADESILANLRQYGLQDKYVDVVAADSSQWFWRTSEPRLEFDAIITDPPYGKRESRERIGSQKSYKIPDNLIEGHIPSKIEYNLNDIFRDLLSFSAYHLRVGGRLVFWLPYDKQIENFDIRRECHPCLRLVSTSEQILSTYCSRILICVEKTRQCNELPLRPVHTNCVNITQTDYELSNNLENGLKI